MSVLFADWSGFTPSETRDAEEVRELLTRYFDVGRSLIERYGGVVEKFIGDAVMAVWGTPVATKGDAERAVRAALDLVAAVADLGAECGVARAGRACGLVTGEVAVSLGARQQGMVAGDAVNTASRVQAAAEPGSVLVDGATRRLADGGVGFADAGEHVLKGKAEPARLWRATRVVAGLSGAQRVDGLRRLIGRDGELRIIKELFHAAAERRAHAWWWWRAGRGRKVAPGLGVREVRRRPGRPSGGTAVAACRTATGSRSGRWPRQCGNVLGIAEEDPAQVAAARLAAGLEEFVPDPAERAYAGTRLSRLLGVPVEGTAGRRWPGGAVRRVAAVLRAARR